jgi:hypothetical protein
MTIDDTPHHIGTTALSNARSRFDFSISRPPVSLTSVGKDERIVQSGNPLCLNCVCCLENVPWITEISLAECLRREQIVAVPVSQVVAGFISGKGITSMTTSKPSTAPKPQGKPQQGKPMPKHTAR